jgi:hypothetical protein
MLKSQELVQVHQQLPVAIGSPHVHMEIEPTADDLEPKDLKAWRGVGPDVITFRVPERDLSPRAIGPFGQESNDPVNLVGFFENSASINVGPLVADLSLVATMNQVVAEGRNLLLRHGA